MIEFSQELKGIDYKTAALLHYRRFRVNALYTALAVILTAGALTMLNLMALHFNNTFALPVFADFILTVFGIIVVFRKHLYARKVFKSAKRDKNFGMETSFKFHDDGACSAIENGEINDSRINDFYGYYLSGNYILLYPVKNIFFILKREAGREKSFYELINLLDKLKIKRL